VAILHQAKRESEIGLNITSGAECVDGDAHSLTSLSDSCYSPILLRQAYGLLCFFDSSATMPASI
jgi:hypothetical protein